MKNATLVFLIKKNAKGKIIEILLAMKKRGFGEGRWNGVGGKTNEGETALSAAIRETKEEIAVDIKAKDMNKVAEINFKWPNKTSWEQLVHVYIAEKWTGEPTETEEMAPRWFNITEIPYQLMWPDDIEWMPMVIEGKLLIGNYLFNENAEILERTLTIVETF